MTNTFLMELLEGYESWKKNKVENNYDGLGMKIEEHFVKPNMNRLIPLTTRISRMDYISLLRIAKIHNLTISEFVRITLKRKLTDWV